VLPRAVRGTERGAQVAGHALEDLSRAAGRGTAPLVPVAARAADAVVEVTVKVVGVARDRARRLVKKGREESSADGEPSKS
jgi:hypothetical protein